MNTVDFAMIIPSFFCAFIGEEIVNLVLQSGIVAKTVLLILLVASVFSWAIILSKWSMLRRARTQSGRFVRAFRKAARIQDLIAVSDQFKPSPLVPVFEELSLKYFRTKASFAARARGSTSSGSSAPHRSPLPKS